MKRSKEKGVKASACEFTLNESMFFGNEAAHNLQHFKGKCDIIIVNKYNKDFGRHERHGLHNGLHKRFI